MMRLEIFNERLARHWVRVDEVEYVIGNSILKLSFLQISLPFMKSYIFNGHTVHAVSKCNLDRNMVFAKPIYIVQSKVTKWYDKRGQGYILCNWVEYHGANLSGILCFARKCLFVCTLGSQALQFHYGCKYQ